VIETQISFSSSIALNKNELFHKRIRKLQRYFAIQIVMQTYALVLLTWLFYYANFSLIALLIYPVSFISHQIICRV